MVKRFKKPEGKKLIHDSYNELLSLWNVSYTERDIDTIFGRTHIIISGNPLNPPLLLFHGVGDDSALMWVYNAADFTKHFYLIAVDTIGGPGKSEPAQAYYKKFEQAEWIDQLLDSLSIPKVCTAGVSNGAYLAQYYTVKRPERVIKCVCMSGSAAVKATVSPIWRMLRVFFPEAFFPNRKNIFKLIRKMMGTNYHIFTENKQLMEHWFYLLKYFNPQSMAFHKINAFDTEELSILKERALFILGKLDPLSYHQKALGALDSHGLRYIIVRDAGHGINHERPDIIRDKVIPFLLGRQL